MSTHENSTHENSALEGSTHAKSTVDKLVYSANQIGSFFKTQDTDTVPAKVAEHILKYWDPRMRAAIIAHLDAGGAGLDTASRQAVELLRRPKGTA